MPPRVLCKQNEQVFPFEKEVQFTFKHTNYRIQLEMEVTPTLASIPCGKCNKTSRDIIKAAGVDISNNDMAVDVLEIIHSLPGNEDRSILESDYVFVISNVDVDQSKIENVDAMTGVQSAREAKELTAHVKKCLLGEIMCDGCCFTTDHIENLLQAV